MFSWFRNRKIADLLRVSSKELTLGEKLQLERHNAVLHRADLMYNEIKEELPTRAHHQSYWRYKKGRLEESVSDDIWAASAKIVIKKLKKDGVMAYFDTRTDMHGSISIFIEW